MKGKQEGQQPEIDKKKRVLAESIVAARERRQKSETRRGSPVDRRPSPY